MKITSRRCSSQRDPKDNNNKEDIYARIDDNDGPDTEWVFLHRKTVPDSDGFLTYYTMYRDVSGENFICMFGDDDIYEPSLSDADASFDTYEEALEWFNSYNGFEDEEDEDPGAGLVDPYPDDEITSVTEISDDQIPGTNYYVRIYDNGKGSIDMPRPYDDADYYWGQSLDGGKTWRIIDPKHHVFETFDTSLDFEEVTQQVAERLKQLNAKIQQRIIYNSTDIKAFSFGDAIKKLMNKSNNVDDKKELEDVMEDLLTVNKDMWKKYAKLEDAGSPAEIGKQISEDLYWMYQQRSDRKTAISSSADSKVQRQPGKVRRTIKELNDELYNASAKLLKSDKYGFPLSEISNYLFIDIDVESDGRIHAEVRAELSYEGMEGLKDVLDPIIQKYDPMSYFEMVEPGIMEAYIEKSDITSASYGGAYDISDDQYFTKDDLMEFADQVSEMLEPSLGEAPELEDIYIEQNVLHVEMASQEFEVYTDVKIDMRKIRLPQDLIRRYSDEVAQNLKQEFKDAGADVAEDIESAYIPEQPLEPVDDESWEEVPTVKQTIHIEANDVIIYMDADGQWTYEDDNYNFASSDDNGSDWYFEDYPQVRMDDVTGVVEKFDELIAPSLPMKAGRYKINGSADLVYELTGLNVKRDYIPGELGLDWDDEEVDSEYAESTYIPSESKLIRIEFENA